MDVMDGRGTQAGHGARATGGASGHFPHLRPWMLLVGMIGLAAGHSVILYYLKSHATLSAAVVSGVIVLVVIKHLGLFGPLYALVRRRSRQARSGASVARGRTPGHPNNRTEQSSDGN